MSSSDPRALALYMRAGMRPHWPHFSLLLADTTQNQLSASELEVVEAQVNDPALLEWDRRASGRSRPEDHAFWIEQQEGVPLWFKRSGKVVGYGFARLGARMLAYPRVCALGPIGAATEDEASACVLAAVHWASQRAQTMSIEVPGPHPCLLPLLQAGFKIQYADTYMSSAPRPFFDPARLIASGSDLF